ncbi:hypothetical protein DFJ74DRAFT_662925 [Hyaloraphidium curvatum]|nr:hypothetical protein DFJ74DRAFT_662925 [Hyaloraphidium curvatum]
MDYLRALRSFGNPLVRAHFALRALADFYKILFAPGAEFRDESDPEKPRAAVNELRHRMDPSLPGVIWIGGTSRDFLFSCAAIDASAGPVALVIPAWTDDAPADRPMFYVAGCHAVYDHPIGIMGAEPAKGNTAVSSLVTGNKAHVVVYVSEASGYKLPEMETLGGMPVTVIRIPGNVAMLLFRILHVRGSGPEPPEGSFESDPPVAKEGAGRWSLKEKMNDFQRALRMAPLHDLAGELGIADLPPKLTPSLPDLCSVAPRNPCPPAIDFWNAISVMAAYYAHTPSSPDIDPVWATAKEYHIHPLPSYPDGRVPHLADRLTPPDLAALESASADADFLLNFVLTKTSGIAAVPANGYWVSSRTLAVQPPELDKGWGDLIKRAARSSRAVGGLFPGDVTYFSAFLDREGRLMEVPKEGKQEVRFRVPLGDRAVPVKDGSFWSANLYKADDLSQMANRWGLWARTGDFALATDTAERKTATDLILSAEPWAAAEGGRPGMEPAALPRNWIPLPPGVPANIVVRTYGPTDEVLDGQWAPKGIIREVWDGQAWAEDKKRGWFW